MAIHGYNNFSVGRNQRAYYSGRIVFSYSEAFLSCEDGLKVLQSTIYLSAVKAVIVDEAHCILEW